MITVALLIAAGLCTFTSCVLAGQWLNDLEPKTEHEDNVRSAIMLALVFTAAASLVAVFAVNGWWVGP